jgi:hypothetical protein
LPPREIHGKERLEIGWHLFFLGFLHPVRNSISNHPVFANGLWLLVSGFAPSPD